MEKPTLEVEPLLAYVKQRGGLLEFFPYYEVEVAEEQRKDRDLRGSHPADRLRFRALGRALIRARESGALDPLAVDALCGRLGVHPAEVYGEAWFEVPIRPLPPERRRPRRRVVRRARPKPKPAPLPVDTSQWPEDWADPREGAAAG